MAERFVRLASDAGNSGKRIRAAVRPDVDPAGDQYEHLFRVLDPHDPGAVPVGLLLRELLRESRRQTQALLLLLNATDTLGGPYERGDLDAEESRRAGSAAEAIEGEIP